MATEVWGQVDLVDPDAPATKKVKPEEEPPDEPDPNDNNPVRKVDSDVPPRAEPAKVDAGTRAAVPKAEVKK